VTLPADYALRGAAAERIARELDAHGFAPVAAGAIGEGDLMLLAPGPHQAHLAIRTADGFVHADAGLRRVVETPGWPRWPIIGAWRAPDLG
jgi:hypothetical protein